MKKKEIKFWEDKIRDEYPELYERLKYEKNNYYNIYKERIEWLSEKEKEDKENFHGTMEKYIEYYNKQVIEENRRIESEKLKREEQKQKEQKERLELKKKREEKNRKDFNNFDKNIVKHFKDEYGINIRLLTNPVELNNELIQFSRDAQNRAFDALPNALAGQMFFYKADKEFSYKDRVNCKSTVFGFSSYDSITVKRDANNPSIPYVAWTKDSSDGVKFDCSRLDWKGIIKEKIHESAEKFVKENPEWFKDNKLIDRSILRNYYLENFPEVLKDIKDLDYLKKDNSYTKNEIIEKRIDLIKNEDDLRYAITSLNIFSPLRFISENKELYEKIKDTSFISNYKENDYLSSIIQNLKSSVSDSEKELRNMALGIYYDDKAVPGKLDAFKKIWEESKEKTLFSSSEITNKYKKDFINIEVAKRFPNINELVENMDTLKKQNLRVINMVSSYISSELKQEKLPTSKRADYEVNLDEIREFYKEKTGKDTDEMMLTNSINKLRDEIERFGK